MRVSKQEKAKTREKIITEAARLFRENGIEVTSVNDIMSAAGLTHGGFYRHFTSKDGLVEAALGRAFDEQMTRLETAMDLGNHTGLATFINMYLSPQHVDDTGGGCPIAAVGGEIERSSKDYAALMQQRTNQMIDVLAKGYGAEKIVAKQRASALVACLVGTLILARQADDKEALNTILSAGQKLAMRCGDL